MGPHERRRPDDEVRRAAYSNRNVPFFGLAFTALPRSLYAVRFLFPIFVMALALFLPLRAFDPSLATPTQMLQQIKLKQDVTLPNGPDVYLKLNDLSTQHDKMDDPAPDLKTEAAFAWMSNPAADDKKLSFTLRKGQTLLAAIKSVAQKRNETVVDEKSYLLIFGEKHPALQDSYTEPGSDEAGQLEQWVGAIIPPGKTTLQLMPGPAFADFINGKFKESLSYNQTGIPAGPFDFKLDPSANAAVGKCNVVGSYSYDTLLRAYCQLLNLRWKITANSLVMEPAPPAK